MNSYVYTAKGNEKITAGEAVDRQCRKYVCDHPNRSYEDAFKAVQSLEGNKNLFQIYTEDSSALV